MAHHIQRTRHELRLEQQCKDLIDNGRRFEWIELRSKEEIDQVTNAIQFNTSLEGLHLTFTGSSLSVKADGLFQFIESSTTLSTLGLQCHSNDTIRDATRRLSDPTCSSVSIKETMMINAEDATSQLWDPCFHAISKNPNIRTLSLLRAGGMKGKSLGSLFKNSKSLYSILLNVADIQLESEDLESLIEGFATNRSVDTIQLYCKYAGLKHTPLIRTLESIIPLQTLKLSGMSVHASNSLRELLQSSRTNLKTIEVGHGHCSHESWKNILEGLRCCRTVRTLVVDDVEVDLDTAKSLHAYIESTSLLTVLDFQPMAKSIPLALPEILAGMASNISVECLQCVLPRIDQTLVDGTSIFTMLSQNQHLRELKITMDVLSLQSFSHGLRNNTMLESLELTFLRAVSFQEVESVNDAIRGFFQALLLHPRITRLAVKDIGVEFMALTIAKYICDDSCTVTDLQFGGRTSASVRDTGIATMIYALKEKNCRLKKLHLGNYLRGDSVEALMNVLPNLNLLESLSINIHPSCRIDLLDSLATSFDENTSLTWIVIHCATSKRRSVFEEKNVFTMIPKRNRYMQFLSRMDSSRMLWPHVIEKLLLGSGSTRVTRSAVYKTLRTRWLTPDWVETAVTVAYDSLGAVGGQPLPKNTSDNK